MNDASLVKIHCTMYHSTCEMICSALDFAHTNPSQITSFQKLHRARGRSGPAILCESCFLGARSIRMHESFATYTRRTRLDVPRRAYEMNLRVGRHDWQWATCTHCWASDDHIRQKCNVNGECVVRKSMSAKYTFQRIDPPSVITFSN